MKTDPLLDTEVIRKELGDCWGINKQEEIIRLLYEISRREGKTPRLVHAEMLQNFKVLHPNIPQISFHEAKQILLKGRYPHLEPQEYSKVLMTRLPEGVRERATRTSQEFIPKKIYVESLAQDYPLTQRVLSRFHYVPTEIISSIKELRSPRSGWIETFGKDTLLLSVEEHDFLKPCPCSKGSLSCNYYILNLGFGCPYDCSYCYLQFYQNTPAIVVYANPEKFVEELEKVLKSPGKVGVRIGTGEFTDSLALDPITGYSKVLVPFFKNTQAVLELKTKSTNIEQLLDLDHGGRTVIAWSLNPSSYANEEEGAPSVTERIEAARKCQDAGYSIAFHLDPIFCEEGWEAGYEQLIQELYETLPNSPKWISLGTFRYHRDLKKVSESRHPGSRIFLGEQIEDPEDGKFRYPERIRVGVYKKMLEWIRRHDSKTPVYLCMEPPALWKAVFDLMPFSGRMDEWIAGSKQ